MEKLLTLTEFAELVGYSRRTIFKKIKNGDITPHLIRNGRNYFIKSQASLLREPITVTSERKSYGYYRVSSNNQKDQLVGQLGLIETFAASRGIILEDSFKDIGSGMNMSRPNLFKIIDLLLDHKVDKLVITHEDRLLRFGFKLIEYIANKCGSEILVINSKTTSPQEEMVEDLMTIIHVFSSRLYGLRSNKKKIDELCRESKDKTE